MAHHPNQLLSQEACGCGQMRSQSKPSNPDEATGWTKMDHAVLGSNPSTTFLTSAMFSDICSHGIHVFFGRRDRYDGTTLYWAETSVKANQRMLGGSTLGDSLTGQKMVSDSKPCAAFLADVEEIK